LPEAFHEWLTLENARLEMIYVDAFLGHAAELERARDDTGALQAHREVLRIDPVNEVSHRAIVRIEQGRGRPDAAARQEQRFRHAVFHELGIVPGSESEGLAERTAGSTDMPTVRVEPSHRRSLPEPRSPFVGREAELAAMDTLVRGGRHRLITLIGLGGVGKSRLAIEFARRTTAAFVDGVVFVPLNHLQEQGMVAPTLARQLRLPTEGEAYRENLLHRLAERSYLIVLDGFEQVVDAAPFVGELVARSSGTCVLVTSRVPLDLQSEQKVAVGGLAYRRTTGAGPRIQGATHLFELRSRRRLAEGDRPHVESICRLLRGLPLAIELAASLTDQLSCREIAAELGAGQFDLLVAEDRDRPIRQQTLRTVLRGSWKLLDPRARTQLAKLSVFQGPFDRDEALHVTGVRLHDLRKLADRSLVVMEEDGRYEMHEVVRWYAAEQLLDRPYGARIKRELHLLAANYLRQRHDARAPLTLEDMEPGIRAFHHLVGAEAYDEACRFLIAFDIRLLLRWGQAKTVLDLHRMVGPSLQDSTLKARSRNSIGLALGRLGRFPEAIESYEQALELCRRTGDRSNEANYLGNLGIAHNISGNLRLAISCHESAVAISEELGDSRALGIDLGCLGLAYNRLGEPHTALGYHRRALIASRRAGDRQSEANHLGNLAHVLLALGDPADALGHAQAALVLRAQLRDKRGEAIDLLCLARIHEQLVDPEQAERHFEAALALNRSINEGIGTCETLFHFGRFRDRSGPPLAGITQVREALTISRSIGDRHMESAILAYLAESFHARGDSDTAIALWLTAYAQMPEQASLLGESIRSTLRGAIASRGASGLEQVLQVGSQLLTVATGATYVLPHVDVVSQWRALAKEPGLEVSSEDDRERV
jgi:predicted ATPase/tetratricopeptide (TPR) repeat protein